MSEFDLRSDHGVHHFEISEVARWHRDHGLQVALAHAEGVVTLNGSANEFMAKLLLLATIGGLTATCARAGDRTAQGITLRAETEWLEMLS